MPMHCKACDACIVTHEEELCRACLDIAHSCLPLAMRSACRKEQLRLAAMRKLQGEYADWVDVCLSSI